MQYGGMFVFNQEAKLFQAKLGGICNSLFCLAECVKQSARIQKLCKRISPASCLLSYHEIQGTISHPYSFKQCVPLAHIAGIIRFS